MNIGTIMPLGSPSVIESIARTVGNLHPGEAIEVSQHLLQEAGSARLTGEWGPLWSPVDRIMEKIVGSSYDIIYHENIRTGNVTFERLPEPLSIDDGRRSYVSPDRREKYGFTRTGVFWSRL